MVVRNPCVLAIWTKVALALKELMILNFVIYPHHVKTFFQMCGPIALFYLKTKSHDLNCIAIQLMPEKGDDNPVSDLFV